MFYGSILVLAALGVATPARCDEGWRHYTVYQPTVTRHDVINALSHPHKYNHCATLAWFRDRWFCLWGSNTHPDEHAPGQRVYFSTSRDGRRWTPIERAFSDSKHAENPVAYPEGRGHQWQPNLGVVEDELWAVWNQGGSAHDFRPPKGQGPDLRGLYFSRLRRSDGRWINRRLEFDGHALPVLKGKSYHIASTQNLYRLRTGRVLAPVTLYAQHGPAADAPPQAEGWWALEKINSVIFTDDLGKSWHLASGAGMPGKSWMPWEPTVWEQPDGSVMMFSRNNSHPELGVGRPTSGEYLLWSASHDGARTWAALQYVPMESVCSRMHVVPLDGRGVWAPAQAGDDYAERRLVMVHNDAPGAELRWAAARRNLALFFLRGSGLGFVAGNSLTDGEPEVAYPQMWRHGDTLAVCYTQANSSPRSIRVALVSPLPEPDRYYVFPRSNDVSPSPRPRRVDNSLAFDGQQHLATRQPVDPGPKGFAFAAWIAAGGRGAVFDTRRESGPGRGFLVQLGGKVGAHQGAAAGTYAQVSLPTKPNAVGSSQPFPADGKWHYLGVTVDNQAGRATFYVDDRSETVPFTPASADALRGATAHVGLKRTASSRVSGFRGVMRGLALYAGAEIGRLEHEQLRKRFAERSSHGSILPGTGPLAKPLVWLDPADQAGLERDFVQPAEESRGGSEVARVDGRHVLRLRDQASAGLDLDENLRPRGDRVALRFRFRVERGPQAVLCTLGDFNQPARVVARDGQVYLVAGAEEQPCGPAAPGTWTMLNVETQNDQTRAWLDGTPPVQVRHRPIATWAYLGEGFPRYGVYPGTRLLVDIDSLGTRVDPSGR
jgi:hypothetical protein